MSAVIIASNSSYAKTVKLCEGFAPQNKMSIPVGAKNAGGIDEATFNKVIDDVSSFYAPIVKKAGGTLQVNRKWTDATVNASAERSGKTWIVNMYGGLARHPVVTADGFATVLCHELGHQIGGFPKLPGLFGSGWASNEGQSDYFATMKCFRRVMEKEDNAAAISSMSIPKEVSDACSLQHKTASEIALCKRGAMAGLVLARLLADLGGSGAVAFTTPDPKVVSKTNDAHPAAQCRLDTYYAGATCGISFNEDFAVDNAAGGACAEERGDKFAFRSRCWFKPNL